MSNFWKSLPLRSKFALGSTIVFVGVFFFALSLQWIAGNLLYAIAWKYSAIVTVPLGSYSAFHAFKSMELRQKLGRQFWFTVFSLPLIIYGTVGLAIMKIPGALVYLLPLQRSVEFISVKHFGSNPQQCLGKSAIETFEYQSFLQAGVCIKGEIVGQMKPGDKLAIEGKRGLGGMLVEKYGIVAPNKPLEPTR